MKRAENERKRERERGKEDEESVIFFTTSTSIPALSIYI